MRTSIAFQQPNGRWPARAIDRDLLAPMRDERLRVMMLGAGFSKAANPNSPTWAELVDNVAQLMKVELKGIDPRAGAMILSWRGSPRPASAVQTAFQTNISTFLQSRAGGLNRGLLRSVHELVTASRCDVIIDLNYDATAEAMLTAGGIPYYRIIGAQVDVHPPLPEGMVVLWKIHGSIEYPSTIVLAPTEYQRIYEVNDLGSELHALGEQAHSIWTLGVGLQDDDVWSFLTAKAKHLSIVAVHLDTASPAQLTAIVNTWRQVLGKGVKRITVLSAPLSRRAPGTLRHCADALTARLATRRRSRGEPPFQQQANTFDDRFLASSTHGFTPSTRAILEEFADQHEQLVHFLLTGAYRRGHRWLPFIPRGDIAITPRLRATVERELRRLLIFTRDFHERFADPRPGRGLLISACAQTVVRSVFEWLEAFDVPHRLVLDKEPARLTIPRGAAVLVGANPFERDVRRSGETDFNPMHVFRPKSPIRLCYPLAAGTGDPRAPLLDEDEWEAAVIALYVARNPRLQFSDRQTFKLDWVAPMFPWGFGRKSIGTFRAESRGTITQAWHLVSNHLSGGRQICKGGSLRDRGETVFMIARRGSIRIGEYDDFVQNSVRGRVHPGARGRAAAGSRR